ncbi:MAG: hypothetical protein ACRDO4_17835, partial [Nocardioides sp.]
MSRAHDGDGADHTRAHELVQELEASIAARLAVSEQAGDEVAQAERQADHLIAEAETQAGEDAQRRRETILASAHAEAARLSAAGNRSAADVTAIAARRRDADVAAVESSVLP